MDSKRIIFIEMTNMEHKEYRKLHAEWYELMSDNIDQSKEINFWVRCIEETSEPVLELGSGTGRVLIPLLEREFEVVGIDTSKDMMDRCLERCKAKGLKPELHEQSMLKFDLHRKFGMIFLSSGGLGLLVSDEDIRTTFKRVMANLKLGGTFAFGFEPLPADNSKITKDGIWGRWEGDWLKGPDDIIISWRRRRKYDPKTHLWECIFIVEKFVGGVLVETEANERIGRYFSTEEVVDYARTAGFENISVVDFLTGNQPDDSSREIVIRCKKPTSKINR